jgi:hypothetical protein
LLGIAAIDAAAQPTDERHHRLARSKTTVGIGPHRSDAFDAGDFGNIAP